MRIKLIPKKHEIFPNNDTLFVYDADLSKREGKALVNACSSDGEEIGKHSDRNLIIIHTSWA